MDLALDSVAVFERFTMKMLIAIVAAQRLHVGHPEMVGERTDLAHCLFEGVLDLEAQSVQTNDVEGVEGSVGAHEEAGASYGVDHCHEAHHPAGRTPQQIADPILDDHLVLAVDGTWSLLEVPGGLQQGAELDLPAIDPGAAWLARPALLVSGIGDAVTDQDAPAVDAHRLGEQPQHHLAPQLCEPVELHRGAVEAIEEGIVAPSVELQRAHNAGYAQQFRPHREACHGGGEPQEGLQAGESRGQPPDRVPPGHPQGHRGGSFFFLTKRPSIPSPPLPTVKPPWLPPKSF